MRHEQQVRYARHISLPEVGLAGQQKLAESSVLIVGAGGLGAPLALYLAASGIGRLGIIDADRVALSNLPRQILYEQADIGRLKIEAARDVLLERNSEVKLELYNQRLEAHNANRIMANYDIIADGCDNFATRLLVNEICHRQQKTLVAAAIIGFSGQISTYKSYLGQEYPCYQCLVGELPPEDTMPNCSNAGILAPVAGVMACWQATEIIKELLCIGESLSGTLVQYNSLNAQVRRSALIKEKHCKICA